MEIHSLSATFGRLENETLDLEPGLNIIEAANESGKSTWMAFLRVMLYGLNTRDRSPLADKRRYQPWTGNPMQGQLDLVTGSDAITIRRSSRPDAPLSIFSACYQNTSTPVPGLTAANCGGSLLGIPQEVFERSAFIRQSGIPIDRSAPLERRIAALVTTGEEDSSYTDAADTLRRQLNRRRHNKTGLIPQTESEIRTLTDTLSELTELESTLHARTEQLDTLTQQEAHLHHQLSLIESQRNAGRAAQIAAAREKLQRAEAARAYAERHTEHLPSHDTLSSLTASLDALRPLAQSTLNSRSRAEECAQELEKIEKLLTSQPFHPQTPENAAKAPLPLPPRPRFPTIFPLVGLFLAAGTFLTAVFMFRLSPLISLGTALILVGLSVLVGTLFHRRRRHGWENAAELLRRRRNTDLGVYTKLYTNAEKYRTDLRSAKEAYRSLALSYRSQLTEALNEVHKFAPAEDVTAARRAISSATACYTALAQATQAVKDARLRYDLLMQEPAKANPAATESPTMTREQAEIELAAVSDELLTLRREIHTTEGRIQALGDRTLLQNELDNKRERLDEWSREYSALSLASEVLNDANAALQSRFSPALGEKSANIFTKLTRGKYNKVLLDRNMTPSAQEKGNFLSREAAMLSQGTADQLYLAVRLAICDTVLPPERSIPILLDDALVTFDDERMAAALDYLVELSQTRQVILFTCQKRELRYLASAHPGRYHAVTQNSAV